MSSVHENTHGHDLTKISLSTDMRYVLIVRLFSLIILLDLREHKSFLSRLNRQLDRSVFVYGGCLSVRIFELKVKRHIDNALALHGQDPGSSCPFYQSTRRGIGDPYLKFCRDKRRDLWGVLICFFKHTSWSSTLIIQYVGNLSPNSLWIISYSPHLLHCM